MVISCIPLDAPLRSALLYTRLPYVSPVIGGPCSPDDQSLPTNVKAMWKMALVAFLVVALVVLVVVFVRNTRAKGFPVKESLGHHDQARGAMPPTPGPNWPRGDVDPDDTR